MKVISYSLASVVIVFSGLVFYQLMSDDKKVGETLDLNEAILVKADHHLITSINILMFAYSVQFMTFPTY